MKTLLNIKSACCDKNDIFLINKKIDVLKK